MDLKRRMEIYGTFSRIVAVDFDNVIFPIYLCKEGESESLNKSPIENGVSLIKELYRRGDIIIINSARNNVSFIKCYLDKYDIPHHKINESWMASEGFGKYKVLADIYIDDLAVNFSLETSIEDIDKFSPIQNFLKRPRMECDGCHQEECVCENPSCIHCSSPMKFDITEDYVYETEKVRDIKLVCENCGYIIEGGV